MSSGRNLDQHHKTRLKNCKGHLKDDVSLLDENDWVYWCPKAKGGWSINKCICKK